MESEIGAFSPRLFRGCPGDSGVWTWPNMTFEDEPQHVVLGSRGASQASRAAPHTAGGQCVVGLPQDGVVFSGDIVEESVRPFYMGDAYPQGTGSTQLGRLRGLGAEKGSFPRVAGAAMMSCKEVTDAGPWRPRTSLVAILAAGRARACAKVAASRSASMLPEASIDAGVWRLGPFFQPCGLCLGCGACL